MIVITIHSIMGGCYSEVRQYEKSIWAYERCSEFQLNILQSDHLDFARTHFLIGMVHVKMEDYEDALFHLEECLKIQASRLAWNDGRLMKTQSCIEKISK